MDAELFLANDILGERLKVVKKGGVSMKKAVWVLLIAALCGCSAANSYRCILDAQARHNTSYVKVTGDIDHAKAVSRDVMKEMSLVETASERPKNEKSAYLICQSSSFLDKLFGKTPKRLEAFFYDYDSAANMTDIKIVEKIEGDVPSIREKIAVMIEQKAK
jgi:hypothetical protein